MTITPEPEPDPDRGPRPSAATQGELTGGLETSYHWQGPTIIATVVAVVFVVLLARSQVNGWFTVALIVALIAAGFITLARFRAKAYLAVDGADLTVRRYRAVFVVDGRDVVAVREYITSRGPCYRLQTTGRWAGQVVHVPTAWLRRGHSTFFGWLLTWAPEVSLDRGSRRTLERLIERGLVDGDLDPQA